MSKKYKLIKIYPNSQPLGTIVRRHFDDVMDYYYQYGLLLSI